MSTLLELWVALLQAQGGLQLPRLGKRQCTGASLSWVRDDLSVGSMVLLLAPVCAASGSPIMT
eukprot:6559189-Prorocentrum_lima.AAC.1